MKVTWTVPVEIPGCKGQQVMCRSEEEGARLVLELLLAGVKRRYIIVDGASLEKSKLEWVFKAMGV